MNSNKVNFNSKHLMTGDPLPSYNGKPRLYNMRFCPYAHRIVLAMNAKNIDYEVINVDLIDKPEWITSKSAFAKVPALEVADGVSIYESLVIAEYLDDVYPERPLLPKDPIKKAYDKIIVEASKPINDLIVRTIKAPQSVTDDVLTAYFKALDFIQSQLQQRGTSFLDGEQPGYADFMIWPFIERLISTSDEKLKMDTQKYKTLLAYFNNMSKVPVVQGYALPTKLYEDFNALYAAGKKPNYDQLLLKHSLV